MDHNIMILDYSFHGPITCFVKILGFDQVNNSSFEGLIRMVDGIPYGDLIKEGISELSNECIDFITLYLEEKYREGYFT